MTKRIADWKTPPELARMLGIAPDKVLSWIRAGELRAVDLSENRGKRPRWRISRESLDEFLKRRAATPPPKPRRRRKPDANVTQYY